MIVRMATIIRRTVFKRIEVLEVILLTLKTQIRFSSFIQLHFTFLYFTLNVDPKDATPIFPLVNYLIDKSWVMFFIWGAVQRFT